MPNLVTAAGTPSLETLEIELTKTIDHLYGALSTAVVEAKDPLRFKRAPIATRGTSIRHKHVKIERESENYAELINQLATMVRLRDAMTILQGLELAGEVRCCNPTTSASGHDLEVNHESEGLLVVEANDLINAGNNSKLVKDLMTLAAATKSPGPPRRFMACSPDSARFLRGRSKACDKAGLEVIAAWELTEEGPEEHTSRRCVGHNRDDLPTHLLEFQTR